MAESKSFQNGRMKAENEINQKMQNVGVSLDVRNGAPPTKKFNPPADLKSHPMFSETDYDYFRGKGYNDSEIKKFWDRDSKNGNSPVDWSKNKQFKEYR